MPVRLFRMPAALAVVAAPAVFAVTAPVAAQPHVAARPDTAPPRHAAAAPVVGRETGREEGGGHR